MACTEGYNCTFILTVETCQVNEFTCSDGNCIPIAKKCNLDFDCRDRSDEITCKYQIIIRYNNYTQMVFNEQKKILKMWAF